jgi:hypothetical protein
MVDLGKHSVYIYFPTLDKFYSSMIAVEAQDDVSPMIEEDSNFEVPSKSS